MAKLQLKSMFERKKILPLVITLANSILKELGQVKKINETVKWDRTHWEVSPGDLAKVLVLSAFFDVRTPLTHLADRFEGIDVELFLNNDSKSNYVISFNTGRALERIGEIDYEGFMFFTPFGNCETRSLMPRDSVFPLFVLFEW